MKKTLNAVRTDVCSTVSAQILSNNIPHSATHCRCRSHWYPRFWRQWVVAKGWAANDKDWNLFGSEESQAKNKGLGMWRT